MLALATVRTESRRAETVEVEEAWDPDPEVGGTFLGFLLGMIGGMALWVAAIVAISKAVLWLFVK